MKNPHNIEAEQALLGALMLNNEFYEIIEDALVARHFYDPVHQRIFSLISSYVQRGITATFITLKSALISVEDSQPVSLSQKDDQDAHIAGDQNIDYERYLVTLSDMATTIVDVKQLAAIIYDLALKRELMKIGEAIYSDVNKGSSDLDNEQDSLISTRGIMERAEQRLFNITESGFSERSFYPLSEIASLSLQNIELAYHNTDSLIGVDTGFIDLNRLLGGFQKSDLLILAGRPAMGKSAFAINLAMNACKSLSDISTGSNKKQSVGFFSLEMSSEQIGTRILAMESQINSNKIRMGDIHESEFEKVVKATQVVSEFKLFIDDTPSITISSLRTRARRLHRKHNMFILFVDYLQLIRGVSRSSEVNRVNEVSEITQGLKAIAKELNIPVVALSQLSRAVEARDDKRPQLSDLRESGSIEQDADVVMFIYRDEYYERRKQPAEGTDKHIEWQTKMEQIRNQSEIIIAKQRNGPVGSAKLFFDYNTTIFRNYADDEMHY